MADDKKICEKAVEAAGRILDPQPGDAEALIEFCDMVTGLPPGALDKPADGVYRMDPPPPFKQYKGVTE